MAEWMEEAACSGTTLCFVEIPCGSATLREVRQRQAYCRVCPVRDQCLQYGVTSDSVGVWGGVYRPHGNSWRRALQSAPPWAPVRAVAGVEPQSWTRKAAAMA